MDSCICEQKGKMLKFLFAKKCDVINDELKDIGCVNGGWYRGKVRVIERNSQWNGMVGW